MQGLSDLRYLKLFYCKGNIHIQTYTHNWVTWKWAPWEFYFLERSCKFIKTNTFVKSASNRKHFKAQQTEKNSLRHHPHFKTHNAAAVSLSCLSVAESDYYCQYNNHHRVEHGKWGKWRFIYPIGKEMNAEQWVALGRKEVEVKRIKTWQLTVRNKLQSKSCVRDTSLCIKAFCIQSERITSFLGRIN